MNKGLMRPRVVVADVDGSVLLDIPLREVLLMRRQASELVGGLAHGDQGAVVMIAEVFDVLESPAVDPADRARSRISVDLLDDTAAEYQAQMSSGGERVVVGCPGHPHDQPCPESGQ